MIKSAKVLHESFLCLALSFTDSFSSAKTRASGGGRLLLRQVITQRHGSLLDGFGYPNDSRTQTLPRFLDVENYTLGTKVRPPRQLPGRHKTLGLGLVLEA